MRNDGLNEAQAGIKIAGRNINNLRYADDANFMAESKEELENLLMKMKEESEKAVLKLNIQKKKKKQTKIIAPVSITSWQVDGEIIETMTEFILGGPKILEDGDFSQEINRHLLLGRKSMIILDSILLKKKQKNRALFCLQRSV